MTLGRKTDIRLAFAHLRKTTNVGDRWCSPFDHLPWANMPGVTSFAQDMRLEGPDYDVAIFGGGKILREIAHAPFLRQGDGRQNIAWGISTVQRNPFSWAYNGAKRKINLMGSRDWDGRSGGVGGCDWVPCASNLLPVFDTPPQPAQHAVVVYAHSTKGMELTATRAREIPWMENHHVDLQTVLAFLASGETVVTNSYHGTFWALLLGRRVLCVPFSNKFSHFRLPPGFSTAGHWHRDLHAARAQPDLLDLCRTATAQFHQKVVARILG